MKCPPVFASEQERIEALAAYGLAPGQSLTALESVVQLAARAFGMPVAAVNMIGSDQVFFAASSGIEEDGEGVDLRREVSFCAHAIAHDGVMVVPDAALDERFHDNPLVTGAARLRFYAGVPLLSPQGHALGALCVIDQQPRHDFSEQDRQRLRELAGMASDRLELRRIEVSLERDAGRFDAFARNSPTAVAWFGEDGRVMAWNQAAAALFGYASSEGVGRHVADFVVERDRPVLEALMARARENRSVDGLVMPDGLSGLRKDGSEFELGFSLFCWNDHGRTAFNVHLQDMTLRLRRRAELHRQACTDELTGLANRTGFSRGLEQALLGDPQAAVVLIDLDGFKDVNDTLGHESGDQVLCETARRLERVAGTEGLVARIGGDEFAVMLPELVDEEVVLALARQFAAEVAAPMLVDGHEVRVTCSSGVAIAPLHAIEAVGLVGNADLALYRAKKLGRGQVFVFVQALRMEAAARRLYGVELHRAAGDGEFVLFYQPQVRLSDATLVGAEALIRWQHPQRGLLSPAAFLPALEGGPLAAVVGNWVLDQACAQAAYWRRLGAGDLRIGINLFGAQFRVGDLVVEVTNALERHGLPASMLELEITENIVLEQDERVLDTLLRLRALGVGIAFDDFGTGYASLSLLKEYPLSRLKIDRSFVRGLIDSSRDASVVRAIIDIARSFDLETIAEGVEEAAQCARLRSYGCSEGQGYLFSRPVPAAEFASLYGIGGSKAIRVG